MGCEEVETATELSIRSVKKQSRNNQEYPGYKTKFFSET